MAGPAISAVHMEEGAKRTFAVALEWPGWCRSGKSEEAALEALAAYSTRYSPVAKRAGVAFPRTVVAGLHVVERSSGGMTTDFGAPGAIAAADRRRLTTAEAKRRVSLLRACWEHLDDVAAGAPAALRKGPRGGGRDRDAMLEHVLAAEHAYARKIGVRSSQPAFDDGPSIASARDAIAAALEVASDGSDLSERGWPGRYAAMRMAWHVLDHAWEMQDRSE
jgi:hypothetical protein